MEYLSCTEKQTAFYLNIIRKTALHVCKLDDTEKVETTEKMIYDLCQPNQTFRKVIGFIRNPEKR